MLINSRYLKEESYYNDLYDLFTIQDCLRSVEHWLNAAKDKSKNAELSNYSQEENDKHFALVKNMNLFFIKGEHYRNKSTTINKWVDRDRRLDEKLENTQEPENILCPHCNEKMAVMFRDLYDFDTNSARVLFLFECPACKKRKGVFDNGETFTPRAQHCPKCNKEIKVLFTKKGKVMKWKNICQWCGYTETKIDDGDKEDAAWAEKQNRNRELLKKYRDEFCLSSAEGEDYLESIYRLKTLGSLLKKTEQKRTDPDYQKVINLRRLSVVELEKLISETLEKHKYLKLMLDKPEIGRFVIIPFTVQDADLTRKECDSVHKLPRIIKKALEGTNWRLMSEGVSYRLGYLSGRLKGYEHEEDLLQLIKKEG